MKKIIPAALLALFSCTAAPKICTTYSDSAFAVSYKNRERILFVHTEKPPSDTLFLLEQHIAYQDDGCDGIVDIIRNTKTWGSIKRSEDKELFKQADKALKQYKALLGIDKAYSQFILRKKK